jgi:hypothetical protein
MSTKLPRSGGRSDWAARSAAWIVEASGKGFVSPVENRGATGLLGWARPVNAWTKGLAGAMVGDELCMGESLYRRE